MKQSTLGIRLIILTFFIAVFWLPTIAQDTIPDWPKTIKAKKGMVYGVGNATSTNIETANDKARHFALTNLVANYNKKFDLYITKCDSILGANNEVSRIITSVKTKNSANLKNIETIDKISTTDEETYQVQILLMVNIKDQIQYIQKEINKNLEVHNEIKKGELLKELENL